MTVEAVPTGTWHLEVLEVLEVLEALEVLEIVRRLPPGIPIISRRVNTTPFAANCHFLQFLPAIHLKHS